MKRTIIAAMMSACCASAAWAACGNESQPLTPGDIVRMQKVDGLGTLIFTETGSVPSPDAGKSPADADYMDAKLGVYLMGESGPIWKVEDGIEKCDLDGLSVYFLKDGLVITDLDMDNRPEIWFSYIKECAGDPGPMPMTVIMYEDGKKHVIEGETYSRVSLEAFLGGSFKFGDGFGDAPKVFRDFAQKYWDDRKAR